MFPFRGAIFVAAGVFLLLFRPLAWSQLDDEKKGGYPNFDIRDSTSTTAQTSRSRVTGAAAQKAVTQTLNAMSDGKAALSARVPTLQLEMNRWNTAPEAIGTSDAKQFLTAESSRANADTATDFLLTQAPVFGLSRAQAKALVKIADYYNPAGNMGWVEYRQEANGIPIFQGEIRLAFTARGALARTTGNLVAGLNYSTLPAKALISSAEAATRAAAGIGVAVSASKIGNSPIVESSRVSILDKGPFVRPVRTELVYFPLEPGVATLAYSMVLWEPVDAYYVIVDAGDGTLLWRKNITAHQTQTASYSVYTDDSPGPLSPSNVLPGTGTQAPGIGRNTVTLIGNEAPNVFNNLGWMTDGINTTTGNNVDCGLDLSSPNGIDTNGRAVGTPDRVFDFAYNPPPLGTDAPTGASYRSGVVTNLFYWTNIYHDRLYLLGFNEAARNFQTNNFGRGGTGNDAVSAEVQDSSGTNNANFSTPADGSPGRMQMYLFTGPTPQRDGALETDVFLHELTHGVSNRLHSNGSGLTSQQAGGLGEGWSDFYARAIASTADEDMSGVYASGNYVTYLLSPGFTDNYYYGIRRFPYAVKASLGPNGKPHNPMTFGDIDFVQINSLNNGAYPPSPVIGITANEVHNVGTIWCMMLLEVRARMIARLGWQVGNQRMLQIVTDAMKLDVASPTLVQARDSIIAADNAGFAGADVADIRSGFATRGAGVNASTTGSTVFTIVESYFPGSAPGTITFFDVFGNGNGVAEPGEDLAFTVPMTNGLTTTDNNVSVRLGNYIANYGNIGPGATTSRTLSVHVPADTPCGAIVQIPFTVTSDNGTGNITVPVRVGSPTTTISFSENFDGVTAPNLPAGWTQTTAGSASAAWKTATSPVIDAGNCANATDLSTPADATLVSPVIAIGAGSQQLSFKHLYTTETTFDGGVLEISIAGGAFVDVEAAGGSFVQGGYGASIRSTASGSALIGRRAWSGSISTPSQVIVDLPPAASGQNVQFRWRFSSDSGTGSTGWNIDSVQVSSVSYSCAPIDTDGDGIPDGWESLFGLNPNDPTDAAQDFDGDGMTNLQEYIAGNDPNNANNVLKIFATSRDPITGAVKVSFATVKGRLYRVEYNDSLISPNSWVLLQDDIVGTGSSITFTDPGAVNVLQRFYRIIAHF